MKFYTNVYEKFNKMYVRGYEDGDYFSYTEEYHPTLYVLSKKKSKYKTLDGLDVEPIKPGKISECKDFFAKYAMVKEFPIYGNDNYKTQYISEKYTEDEIIFDIKKIRLVTIDIEVASESGFPNVFDCAEELLAITLQNYATKNIISFASRPYNNTRKDVKYVQCEDEVDLVYRFLAFWEENTPDVVTGWNCELYDIPYIVGRIDRILGEKEVRRLSPWGDIRRRELVIKGREQISYEIAGVSIIDYLDLYKKFTYKAQESYRLDYIAEVELGQNKLDHSEFDTFKDFYTKDWQKFIDYNIRDVELVDQLEDKMKLIELALTMAYDAKVNFNDIFFQVRTWDAIIFNYLKKKNIVIPPKDRSTKSNKFAGAYVKEPKPGMYDYVVSFDLNSLYPHLIMGYNISSETLLEEKHPTVTVDKILNKQLDFSDYKDYAVCPNGAMYRKDVRGFLPELMEKMYNERVIFKKKMLEAKKQYEKNPTKELEKEISRCNNIQMAKKISLNSAYGAIGNEYFRYYKLANAEAITTSGQVAIRWIENKMNVYLNKLLKTNDIDYVIASDTDSIYLHMGPLVETVYKGRKETTESIVSFLDKICKVELEKYIESCYEELAEYVNAYAQKMQMKRETIADRGIWTAKKRYILNAWDVEGVRYEEPKLKIMGIEAVKSSTPAPCRKMIKDALKLIMSGTENDVIAYIDNCRKIFNNLSPEEISFPRMVSDVDKHNSISKNILYGKGTPIHARGALVYNYIIKEKKLDKKYARIQNGEKIKFCYLKLPNPIHENVIAFISEFPKELKLDKYINYELQFEKAFLDPLKSILDVIGWKIEHITNLESFFN
jgi:DNA polymerase elongation subunit (family B)